MWPGFIFNAIIQLGPVFRSGHNTSVAAFLPALYINQAWNLRCVSSFTFPITFTTSPILPSSYSLGNMPPSRNVRGSTTRDLQAGRRVAQSHIPNRQTPTHATTGSVFANPGARTIYNTGHATAPAQKENVMPKPSGNTTAQGPFATEDDLLTHIVLMAGRYEYEEKAAIEEAIRRVELSSDLRVDGYGGIFKPKTQGSGDGEGVLDVGAFFDIEGFYRDGEIV